MAKRRKVQPIFEHIHLLFTELTKELFRNSKRTILYLIGIGVAVIILIPIITYLIFVWDLSSKEKIINRNSAGVVLLDRNDKEFFSFYQGRTKKVTPLSQIPKYTQQAVISVEDRDFYEHQGFSPRGFARAVVENLRDEPLSQGGSTITQQLVKTNLLSPDKNFLRKYQELVLALEIDRRFSKDDILEMYLNTSYFGEGAYGIEDASEAYFSKPASQLTLGESALLAGILPAPSAYSPITGDRERAFERQKLVLERMVEQGYITQAQADEAAEENIVFKPKPLAINDKAPHFALMVKEELIEKYGEPRIARSGFRVRTTLDLAKQEYAEGVVENQVARLAGNDVTNGAAVAIDPKTGEILVLVGSHDYYDESNGKINMALRPRQPGSSFKPIVYGKALEDRSITPATELDDKAITFPDGYKPKNYDNKFREKTLARFALAQSLNIPAIHVMERVGIPDTIEFAKKLGITTLTRPSDYGLSMVLGAAEVPLLQMTSAFGVFADEGKLVAPTTIIDIKDKNGKSIYEYKPDPKNVMDPRAAFQISSILSDNAARQPVFGNSLTLSRTAAVKTGTTEDYRDALTIGYTPSLVVGVWIGNNDNTPMSSVAGSSGAAPVWRLIMENILRGTPVEKFREPLGMINLNVCKENGLVAKVATSSAYPEYFISGTAPKRSCTEGGFPTATPTNRPEENNDDPTNTPAPEATNTPAPTSADTPTPVQETPTTTP
jgi:1A family penicillin-binding protein